MILFSSEKRMIELTYYYENTSARLQSMTFWGKF